MFYLETLYLYELIHRKIQAVSEGGDLLVQRVVVKCGCRKWEVRYPLSWEEDHKKALERWKGVGLIIQYVIFMPCSPNAHPLNGNNLSLSIFLTNDANASGKVKL